MGTPCYKQLLVRAQQQLRSSRTFNPTIRARLDTALSVSLAGRDDSFISPGSIPRGFDFHWSQVAAYFDALCHEPGGAAALSSSGLESKLIELDEDICNGLRAFRRARGAVLMQDKMAALKAEFGGRLDALMRQKAQTVYAGY